MERKVSRVPDRYNEFRAPVTRLTRAAIARYGDAVDIFTALETHVWMGRYISSIQLLFMTMGASLEISEYELFRECEADDWVETFITAYVRRFNSSSTETQSLGA